MPTYTVYADSTSGTYNSIACAAASTWSSAIATSSSSTSLLSGTYLSSYAQNLPSKSGDQYVESQIFLEFDCSSIPSTDTVTGVTFTTVHTSGSSSANSGLTFDCFVYNYSTSLTTAAWRTNTQLGSLTKVASCTNPASTATSTSWTANGSNFNSAINIGTGAARTKLMIAPDAAVTGTSPIGTGVTKDYQLQMDNPTGTNPPKLVITTTASSSTAASGSGSLSLSGSGAAAGAATGSASLALAATGAAKAASSGSAALALTATGTTGSSPDSGTAAIALTGSGSSTSPDTAAAAITLGATGFSSSPDAGSAMLTFGASGIGGVPDTGSATIALTGSGATYIAGGATLTLSGSGTTTTTAGSVAALTLTGSALEELVDFLTPTASVSTPRGRWIVQDPASGAAYIFPLNPNKMTSPLPVRGAVDIAATGGPSTAGPKTAMNGGDPVQWQFQGFAHDLPTLQTLKNIFNLQGRVLLTDHLGRQFRVRFMTVDTDERYPTIKQPYRYSYTVQAVSYGQVSPMGAAMGPEFVGFGAGGFGTGPFGG